jgi:hypothetical protein
MMRCDKYKTCKFGICPHREPHKLNDCCTTENTVNICPLNGMCKKIEEAK